MAKINSKDIRKQLLADLIGKDSHRGVTLTYSWMANQVGHFSLGFIPTMLVYALLKNSFNMPAFWSAFWVSIFWLAFELYNFLLPLLKKKKSISKVFYYPCKQVYHFTPAWFNIAFDTFTDLCFFWIGAWCASYFILSYWVSGMLALIFLSIMIYPAIFWFLTKMYLQTAEYPIQYRLSQWDFGITENNKNSILNFVRSKESGNHLIISGSPGKGKTSISIATATEISLKHNSGMYTTANKFILGLCNPEIKQGGDDWNWCNCETLIVDDINPSSSMSHPDYIKQFHSYMNAEHSSQNNLEIIRNKNIIWVISAKNDNTADINSWEKLLLDMNVQPEKISKVQL